jgi:hypothetical protein
MKSLFLKYFNIGLFKVFCMQNILTLKYSGFHGKHHFVYLVFAAATYSVAISAFLN